MSAPMEPWQQRVVDEKAELDERATKLEHFIVVNSAFLALPGAEQSRMRAQLAAMEIYAYILGERIQAWKYSAVEGPKNEA